MFICKWLSTGDSFRVRDESGCPLLLSAPGLCMAWARAGPAHAASVSCEFLCDPVDLPAAVNCGSSLPALQTRPSVSGSAVDIAAPKRPHS